MGKTFTAYVALFKKSFKNSHFQAFSPMRSEIFEKLTGKVVYLNILNSGFCKMGYSYSSYVHE